MPVRFLVSACLAGYACRYDGAVTPVRAVLDLVRQGRAVAVCPERLGGLSVPRLPCEVSGGRVLRVDGLDCTEAFARGAQKALDIARANGCTAAILQDKSPSCGLDRIYDGTFMRRLVPGDGLLAALLRREGFVLRAASEMFPDLSATASALPRAAS